MIQDIGFIGLGRMGFHMASRLIEQGFAGVHAWNRSPEKVQSIVEKGGKGAGSIAELISALPDDEPKAVWLMLPAGGVTEKAFQEVLSLLRPNDILIDGANSNFHDSIRRHEEAKAKNIRMLDVGVSGGIVAAERGYAMMFGGDKSAYAEIEPAVKLLCAPGGYALVGETGGSGHYVKMVHNAIEYGMMQAIGEGFDLLKNGRFKELDLPSIAKLWNHGTIVQSFLMEMVERALDKEADLSSIAPFIEDNGEGRWSAIEALEHAVPFTTNTFALYARYASRDPDRFEHKLVAAIRNEFGGHAVKRQ